ncbi:alpha/beta-hydrolase [Marasmius fiardii PR-910]|nr:alpha/beta-hydrolase [Marasmius fiardii PR-910]
MAPTIQSYEQLPFYSPPASSKSMDPNILRESFVLDGHSFPDDPKRNLKVTANRYRWAGYRPTHPGDRLEEGVTILLFHAIGCHKEQWEPIITRLFHLSQSTKNEDIREIWAFDRENHGDAAILNREALKSWPACLPINEWAFTVADLVKSKLRGHRLVAIGHSSGSGVAMLITKRAYDAYVHFSSVVLIEPTIFTRKIWQETYDERIAGIKMSEKVTLRRKDLWASREEAYNFMKKRNPWATWDDRVLRLYTEHGLRSTGSNGEVTLKCPKSLESAIYADVEGLMESAEVFGELCDEIPIHVIWGGSHDFTSFSPQLKKDLLAPNSGRIAASVTVVPDGGHMVPLQQPSGTADTIRRILDNVSVPYTDVHKVAVKL